MSPAGSTGFATGSRIDANADTHTIAQGLGSAMSASGTAQPLSARVATDPGKSQAHATNTTPKTREPSTNKGATHLCRFVNGFKKHTTAEHKSKRPKASGMMASVAPVPSSEPPAATSPPEAPMSAALKLQPLVISPFSPSSHRAIPSHHLQGSLIGTL